MNWEKRTLATAALLLVTLLAGGWVSKSMVLNDNDYYSKVKNNIQAFGRVYQEISTRYVEEIDPDQFIESGINGMLEKLDPHTVYIEKDQTDELQIMTSGKYGGLGMSISKRNDWPTVIEPPFDDTPAQRANIREGDQIIEIDGQSTRDLTISETARRLRGKKGTPIQLKILRQGFADPMVFSLIRDEINPHDVIYAGFIEPGIGYIRLGRFGHNSINEVRDAIIRLKKDSLTSLIFDVRYNPGGLLEAAVAVADNFFDRNKLIVATKGRNQSSNQEFYARDKALLPTEPLVVLVSGYSASASEIVAGAVQDMDRGVIIGQTTFGKGLVQTVVQINRDDALKITTAKYYTPSGRCIQKPDVFVRGRESVLANKEKIKPDSSHKETFKTIGGRLVYGDGGVKPDIAIEPDKGNLYLVKLVQNSMFFNFALNYIAKNSDIPKNFTVDDKILEDFKTFLNKNNFIGEIEGEKELLDLEKIVKDQNYAPEVMAEIQDLKEKLKKEKESEFDQVREIIRDRLDDEISSKLWGTTEAIRRSFASDKEIQQALKVLKNQNEYKNILALKGDVGNYVLK